jgi:hypothetical protein
MPTVAQFFLFEKNVNRICRMKCEIEYANNPAVRFAVPLILAQSVGTVEK